jgi:trehalose 6-phosphate phosphatase
MINDANVGDAFASADAGAGDTGVISAAVSPSAAAVSEEFDFVGLLASGNCALFLDFDGTLVDLAATPEGVVVEPAMLAALRVLHRKLDGRVAIVSGRPIAQIDDMLGQSGPFSLPAAGVHGIERRDASGVVHYAPPASCAAVKMRALQLAARYPGLLVEEKRGAVALHYRQAPELEELCKAEMLDAVQQCSGLVLLHGKMVLEAKPAGINKGTAIRDFLLEAPFRGYRALFAGDDTTDEAGFSYVQENGGHGVKVGQGPTVALHRVATPADLRALLVEAAERLSR